MKKLLFSLLCLLALDIQAATINGTIKDKETGKPIFGALIHAGTHGAYTDQDGNYRIENVPAGNYWFRIRFTGYRSDSVNVEVARNSDNVVLPELMLEVSEAGMQDPVIITDYFTNRPAQKMADVEGTVITAGKKNDVVMIGQMDANVALSNPRQLFARVPGIMAWENDGTGTGVSIATRGLSPNRSWEFNTRQNGYDISSDPIGYPEAYYAPPMEGVERIEILRGAAALQYGSQFGGMVNYKLKRAPVDKPFSAEASLTGGNFGLFNSYTAVGGNTKKLSYYGFYNFRRADGWRENSSYFTNTGFVSAEYRVSDKFTAGIEFTGMYYVLQQPGGLTDSLFNVDPRESFRERNWFAIRWNMPAMTLNYEFSDNLSSQVKIFALMGERSSVGYTGAANTADPMTQRTVDRDYYTNYGAEWRNAWKYRLFGNERSVLSFGARYFTGHTDREQGKGTDGVGAEFIYADPSNLSRDLDLNASNVAVFAENLFRIGKKLKVSPGIRYEIIQTTAEGKPAVQKESRKYNFPLLGVSSEYQLPWGITAYGNWSQSYRPVTFNELWTNTPNTIIDEEIRAAQGWSSDVGVRGSWKNGLYYDVNMFWLNIDGRIGDVVMTDANNNAINFRTNVGNSLNKGVEAYIDLHPLQLMNSKACCGDFGLFSSVAYLEAYYTEGTNKGKRVEYAPRWTVRSGLSWQYKMLSTTFTWTYVDGVWHDAKNTVSSTNGANGWIPSYNVLDWSVTCKLPKNFAVKGSVNNMADNAYFTRHAGGYPGPGIIPADGRTVVITLSMKL